MIMIPHNRPTLDISDISAIEEVVNSGWIAPGDKVCEFERDLSRYISPKGGAVAVDSGTAAIHLALLALGCKKNQEIILPTYVCSALLNAIYYIGAVPVLVDIQKNGFNVGCEEIEESITKDTAAIIVPHMYGTPVEMDAIIDLGIPIIEDCAQSIGSRINGKQTGTFGDIAIFSFYATKLLTTAKGGAIYSNNEEHIDFIKDLINFDCRYQYKLHYNYRMSDLQASLGISQLKRLNSFIMKRREIARIYSSTLRGKTTVEVQKVPDNAESVYYRFVICSEINPENVKDEFHRHGINVINPLEPWELLHNYLHHAKKDYPNAEKIARSAISIPIYPSLTNDEIEQIIYAIEKIF